MMISDRVWRSRYQGRTAVVGNEVVFDGRPATIVGVMPPAIDDLLGDYEWLAPLALAPAQADNFGARYLQVVGRLREGVTGVVAQQALQSIIQGRALGEAGSALGVSVIRLDDQRTSVARDLVLVLFAGVMLLVAIACANVGSMLLAQSLDRHGEFSLRAALGADRGRLMRQMMSETLLLTVASGALGLVVAQWYRRLAGCALQ